MDVTTARAHAEGIRAGQLTRRRGEADELFHLTELAHGYGVDVQVLIDVADSLSSKRPSQRQLEIARRELALAEKKMRIGGVGTPEISEFCCLEVAGLLGCSASAASAKLADALDLRWRHRTLWDAVQDLTLERSRALKAAHMCRELPRHLADEVGRDWAERQERLGWRASFNLLEELIASADAELALKKQEEARRRREVRVQYRQDGTSWLFADMDALDARILDATINELACHLQRRGVAGDMQQLRVKSLGLLAVPALALKIQQEALQHSLLDVEASQAAEVPSGIQSGLVQTQSGGQDGAPAGWEEFLWLAEHLQDREDALADLFCQNRRWPQTPAEHAAIQDFHPPPTRIPIDSTSKGRGAPSVGPRTSFGTCLGHRCGTVEVPVSKLLPKVEVVIHIDASDLAANAGDGDAVGTAWIEHLGSVAAEDLRIMLEDKQVSVRPVLDLNSIAAEERYRPSRAMTDAVRLLHPYEAFPYSTRPSNGCDLDHTVSYQPSQGPGQTALGNLAPLSRRVHRAKTLGAWTCRQPEVGTLEWTSPLGYRYTVESDGTTRGQ